MDGSSGEISERSKTALLATWAIALLVGLYSVLAWAIWVIVSAVF